MKEVLKQALEAMRSYQGDRLESGGEINLEEEIKALEEALSKQEQGEPIDAQIALLDPWMRPAAAKELLTQVLALSPSQPKQEQGEPVTADEKLARMKSELAYVRGQQEQGERIIEANKDPIEKLNKYLVFKDCGDKA